MYQFQIQEDIESRVASQTVRHLHRLWVRFHEAGGDLPSYDDLGPERLDWCSANLMVLEPVGDDDFFYRYYGRAIANASRFDMTGKRTSEFRSDVGRFFRDKYLECLAIRRPLYTVHRATHVPTVHTWERLIMPVREGDGVLLVAFNQPMEFRHEFLQGVLESSSNGIVFAAALREGGSERVVDFQILSANAAAARLLGREPGTLEERTLGEVLPAALRERVDGLCKRVFESGAADSVEVSGFYGGVERVLQASGVRCGDGVTLGLTEATRLRAQQTALHDLEQDLIREREARSRLELRLRDLAEPGGAGAPRREALLESLAAALARAEHEQTPLAVIAIGLDHGTGAGSDGPAVADEESLAAVSLLCRGMVRVGDLVGRIAPTRFAAVLPDATLEAAEAIAIRTANAVALRFRGEPMLSSRLTASAGIAMHVPGESAAALAGRAEAALDEALAAGRAQVRQAS